MDYKIIFVTLLVYSLFLNDFMPVNYQHNLKKYPIDVIICLIPYIIYKKWIFLIPIFILIIKKYKNIINNKDSININQKKIVKSCGKLLDNFDDKSGERESQMLFKEMNQCLKSHEKQGEDFEGFEGGEDLEDNENFGGDNENFENDTDAYEDMDVYEDTEDEDEDVDKELFDDNDDDEYKLKDEIEEFFENDEVMPPYLL